MLLTTLIGASAVDGQSALAAEESCTVLTQANVAACAIARNLGVKVEQRGLDAIEGRRTAASTLLPSNPLLSVSGGLPAESGLPADQRGFLWSATLSQELEVAGQRGARVDVTVGERRAQEARVLASKRDVAAAALTAYFDVLASREEAALAERLAEMGGAFRTMARARAASGVTATVDADLADVAAVRAEQTLSLARQRIYASETALAGALAIAREEAMPRIEGELVPLAVMDAPVQSLLEAAMARRADTTLALAEQQVQVARVAVFRRLRYPNLTVSASVRKDWLGEQSISLGVAVPIPLPSPVGRTYAGEIAEARSLAAKAETEVERVRRQVRLDVLVAADAVVARKREAELYGASRVVEIEGTLRALADEVKGQRLPLRDALITQQSLIGFISAAIEARHALCVASVELARASAVGLDGGAR